MTPCTDSGRFMECTICGVRSGPRRNKGLSLSPSVVPRARWACLPSHAKSGDLDFRTQWWTLKNLVCWSPRFLLSPLIYLGFRWELLLWMRWDLDCWTQCWTLKNLTLWSAHCLLILGMHLVLNLQTIPKTHWYPEWRLSTLMYLECDWKVTAWSVGISRTEYSLSRSRNASSDSLAAWRRESGALLRRGGLVDLSSTSPSSSLLRSLLLSEPSTAAQFKPPAVLRRLLTSTSRGNISLRFRHEKTPPLKLGEFGGVGVG